MMMGAPLFLARISRIFTAFYSAEWSPQASGLAQPPGLAPKVEGAALGSGAQSTVASDFTLGPDPSAPQRAFD